MNGEDTDVPVLVFSGPYSEAMFVKTLLESAGIETSFDNLAFQGRGNDSKVYVRSSDAETATEIVTDCLKLDQRD